MTPDHYATLGIGPGASAAEIRAAYLKLMREHHPDRNPSPGSVERAKGIIAAFKVLSDFDQRSYYDWDRRRDRERAAALVAVPDRTLDKKAAVIGAAGAGFVVAAMAAWSAIMPPPDPPVAIASASRSEAPIVPTGDPVPPRKAAASPPPTDIPARGETMIRMRPALLDNAKAEPVAIESPQTVTRSAVAEPPPPRNIRPAKPPEPRAATKTAPPSRTPVKTMTQPATDIASLDQFVMNFYGQSWRYGDASKRAVLEKTRASFIARRRACGGDSCRRNAYLDLMRDVSAIVESGQPAR